jgi:hypothetical protein
MWQHFLRESPAFERLPCLWKAAGTDDFIQKKTPEGRRSKVSSDFPDSAPRVF